MDVNANSKMGAGAGLEMGGGLLLKPTLKQHYKVECIRKGKVAWVEEFDNLVVTVGLNKYLDSTLKTGVTTPLWYVGLKDTGTVVAADTMASHAGWAELSAIYTEGTRPAWTPGTIANGSVDNSASKAVFTIGTADTVYGAFMVNNSTKGGSTGDLLGGGDFGTPRAVEVDDTMNVTVTCSLS